MKRSFTYHLTLFVLKLKGLKKTFSQDPIDVKKVRKEDAHRPKTSFCKKYNLSSFKVANTTVSQLSYSASGTSNKLTLFIPGGAFISGPAIHHWNSIAAILKETDQHVWMCDYPKAPETKITEISNNIDQVYRKALETFSADEISIVGDSVGATLTIALVQRLIQKSQQAPRKIILVSPVMDATMSNPDIPTFDKIDPMLSRAGVFSAKKMAAGDLDLKDPMISPLYGSFEGFPSTVFFLGTNDIAYPDQVLAVEKLALSLQGSSASAKTELTVIKGEGMPHIWPFLPVMKEAKVALNQVIEHLTS